MAERFLYANNAVAEVCNDEIYDKMTVLMMRLLDILSTCHEEINYILVNLLGEKPESMTTIDDKDKTSVLIMERASLNLACDLETKIRRIADSL